MTDWDKFFEECREHKRQLCEKAASIEPQMLGDLYYVNDQKEQATPWNLYFAVGVNNTEPGECFTHVPGGLYPVYLSRNGQRLVVPEWAELCARFKGGYIRDFYVE